MAYQDFIADWQTTDPFGRLTVAQHSITVNDLARGDDNTRVYYDFTAGYWGGDFDFRCKITTPAAIDADNDAWIYPFALTNVINEQDGIESSGGDSQGFIFIVSGTGAFRFPVYKVEAGVRTTSYPTDLAASTTYYITFQRDDDGGVNNTGRLSLYVATGAYYGAPGSSLYGSAFVDCGVGEQNDFRFIQLMTPRGSGTQATDFYLENLNLDPVLPTKATTPDPADADPAADFLDYTLSWVDGGDSDTFDVYIGESGDPLEIEYSTGDDAAYEIVDATGEGYARGQLFTTVGSFLLDSISLKMYKSADATSSFNVDIVTLSGGVPPLIGTGAYHAARVATKYGDTDDLGTDTGGTWVTIDFSSLAVTLDATTQYAIVVWYSNGGSKTIYWRADNTGTYAGGKLMLYQADPAQWNDFAGDVDGMFKIYNGNGLVLVSSAQEATSLVVPEVDRLPASVKTWYWRIDSNNPYGVTTGDVWSFTLGELPSFDSQSGSETVYVDVVPTPLSVVVSGNPTPTLQWYADGSPLPSETSATYAPPAQSTPVAISYVCRATNALGYTDSTPMVVTWQAIPVPADPTRYNLLNMQSDLDRS